jgi:hypothetical protein
MPEPFAIQQSKTILARLCEAGPRRCQRVGNEIKAAILRGPDFVNVL